MPLNTSNVSEARMCSCAAGRRLPHASTTLLCISPASQVVVDECHCVTEWGHSFRPAYYRLGAALKRMLPAKSLLALTATATKLTEAAICQSLGIQTTLRETCLRENLRLHVKVNTSGGRAGLGSLVTG